MSHADPTTPAAPPTDFRQWMDASRRRIDAAIGDHTASLGDADRRFSPLAEALTYSLKAPGKRIRPTLVLESAAVCDGDPATAMPAALAIEFVHTFSLIHDDLPAMDDDDLRRGIPTNHKVFGEANAILAGDHLSVHAFSLLARVDIAPHLRIEMIAALARGAERMVFGQAADIAGEKRPAERQRVDYIHENKTAALIETSCRLGALCAGADSTRLAALAEYGRRLGLAFQIADDLLDAVGDGQKLGKRTGKDAVIEKQTYPAAYGFEEARRRALDEADRAVAALSVFGGRGERLADLARFVVQRDH